MTCETTRPAALRCPTLPERIAATLALLPSGRAWGADDSYPEAPHDAAFDPAAFASPAFDTQSRQGTLIYRFFSALGAVLHYAESRLCSLRGEFFCATATETRGRWLEEFGLPDACDPFPDLCAKVAAIGGARCEYFQAVAAGAGWSITCDAGLIECGGRANCGRAGRMRAGRRFSNLLKLTVHVAASPAYGGRTQTPPRAGRMRAGHPINCGPNIDGLRCLIERIAPAHVIVSYNIV